MLQSKHFVYSEFACHDGTPYPLEWINDRLQWLCDMLDIVRDAWGGPIHVVCGYRPAAYNARLRAGSSGVAEHSQHVLGTAADIAPVPADASNVRRFCAMLERMLAAGQLPGVGGLGFYPQWAHIDVRQKGPNGHVARWTGAGYGSEPV